MWDMVFLFNHIVCVCVFEKLFFMKWYYFEKTVFGNKSLLRLRPDFTRFLVATPSFPTISARPEWYAGVRDEGQLDGEDRRAEWVSDVLKRISLLLPVLLHQITEPDWWPGVGIACLLRQTLESSFSVVSKPIFANKIQTPLRIFQHFLWSTRFTYPCTVQKNHLFWIPFKPS